MVATSCARLLQSRAERLLRDALLPRATLATPNLDETAVLVGWRPKSAEEMRQAVREIVKVLKSGGGVGLVIDQNYRDADPHFVPFFGALAATTRTLGTMCVRMNVPFITAFAFPQQDGSYEIVYDEPVFPDAIEGEDPALEITARATGLIEAAVRKQPEAWFWMHQRWRTRPRP